MATASLVLGILALCSCLSGWGGFAGFIMAILAIVFSGVGKKRTPEKKGLCTAGLVLGIIALILSILEMAACLGIILGLGFLENGLDGNVLEEILDGVEEAIDGIRYL